MRVGIVGGGIIGCAVARALALRGVDVVVFEARGIGAGATQASAGALVPYVEAHESGPLQELTVRSLRLYDGFVAQVAEESGEDIDYARCGSLEIALSDTEERQLRALAQHIDRAMGPRWVEAAEVGQLEPAVVSGVRGGLLVASHGYVSASQLTRALAHAATKAGVTWRFEAAAAVSGGEADAVVSTTGGAAHGFDHVVVANGAWASQLALAGQAALPVHPVKGELLRIRGPQLQRVLWSPACYVVPQQNGDLLVGATMQEAGFDEQPTQSARRQLWSAASTILSGMTSAELVESRVGLRPGTRDGLPLIGYAKTAKSVVFAVGHFRNGIILAPLTAELITKLLVDGEPDPSLVFVSPSRFGL